MKALDRCPARERHFFQPFSFTVASELRVEKCLIYTPPVALKRPQYHFRHWYSKRGFYLLHYADEWTDRGGRLLVWCRKPPEQATATS